MASEPVFSHRACYVNFAEHLLNHWNANVLFPEGPCQWSKEDWRAFLRELAAFGYSHFEYWLAPTFFDKRALSGEGVWGAMTERMRLVNELAHEVGLKTKLIASPGVMGAEWYFPCPKVKEDREAIFALWSHWLRELEGTDLIGIFPGDPGGCNRNGCDAGTFVDLALDLSALIKRLNPSSAIEVGTWGTPFSGWGDDLVHIPGWDGSWEMLIDPKYSTPETPAHIWNGKPDRANTAMEYLLKRLPEFPEDTQVAINLGFDPDCHATMGGDARGWAREVAKLRPITTWDYSLSEGELICYPHWRLPRIAARRREELAAAPYSGGMNYTMTPKLNLLTLYASGRLFNEPLTDPDQVSREFCGKVFGAENERIGELFEAFEVVQGWGHYPRRQWDKPALQAAYGELVERLEAADVSGCELPLFPDAERYRQDLLWFARKFLELAGPEPDRARIRNEYWQKALYIYDKVPRSVDERAEASADRFSAILA